MPVPNGMLLAITFRAKPGKEEEMKALLDQPEKGRGIAEMMGAHRNLLLWAGDRMVRVMEFDDGVQPVPLAELAKRDEDVRAFLKRLGELTEPGFDPEDGKSFEAFSKAGAMGVLYDVRP